MFELKTSFDLLGKGCLYVSIPFRADTVFEHGVLSPSASVCGVSIPFRADTVFEQEDLNLKSPNTVVSIPFRADTVFEHYRSFDKPRGGYSFNPFQG